MQFQKDLPGDASVKAAGGINTKEDMEKMVKAGASRIGASAGIKIVQGGAAEPTVPVQMQPAMAVVKSY